MKLILTILSLTCSLLSNAANYYFSTAGSDAGSGTTGSPWQTLSKLQTTILAMNNGDSVFLKRGDTWYGQLRLQSFAGNTRYVGAWGSGNKPVITGFVSLTSWSSVGTNIYEASVPTSRPRIGIVTVDGAVVPMGRYPNNNPTNGGYLTFTGGSSTSITGTGLSGTPNYTGWEVVVRKRQFIMDRGTVTSQSTSTVNFTPTDGSGWGPDGIGNGFFFQNSYNAIDTAWEWYYNNSPARFDVYLTSSPVGHTVNVSTIDTVAFIYAQNNLTIDNIRFEGSNMETFRFNNNNGCTVKNCEFFFNGIDGVRVYACTTLAWAGNTIQYSGNNAAYFEAAESTSITNSIFRASGIWPGMGKSNGLSHIGVIIGANSTGGVTVTGNTFDSIGYNGIHVAGNNVLIKNNYVNNFNRTIDDGGGIYSSAAGYDESGRIVRGNIITNGIGNKFGTNLNFYTSSIGIYWDDLSSNVTVDSNFIANMSDVGIYGHNNHGMIIRDNTIYNTTKAPIQFTHDGIAPTSPIRDMIVKRNVLFQPVSTRPMIQIYSIRNDLDSIGTLDSNYYCRPSAEGTAMIYANMLAGNTTYTLSQWKATGKDVFTKQTPAGFVGADSIVVAINPTSSATTTSLGSLGYLNMIGSGFTGTITIPPYQARLVIRKNLEQAVLRGRRKIVATP